MRSRSHRGGPARRARRPGRAGRSAPTDVPGLGAPRPGRGLFELVDVADEGTESAPGVRLLPGPGHTPGQVTVESPGQVTPELSSKGASALISGDSIHHPVRMGHPDLCSCVDIAPELAARTRHRMLDSPAGTSTPLLGSHFPAPTAGHARRQATACRLAPVAPGVTAARGRTRGRPGVPCLPPKGNGVRQVMTTARLLDGAESGDAVRAAPSRSTSVRSTSVRTVRAVLRRPRPPRATTSAAVPLRRLDP